MRAHVPVDSPAPSNRRALRVTGLAGLIVASLLTLGIAYWHQVPIVTERDDDQGLYERIHDLRVVTHDYEAARSLALQFLSTYPSRDLLRQRIHFEFAMCFYDERRFAEALPQLETLIGDYRPGDWPIADERVVLDDAWFYYGDDLIRNDQCRAGYARLLALREQFPGSNMYTRALQYANRALIHEQLHDWEPRPGVAGPGTVDNLAAIEAHAATIAAEGGPPEVTAAALEDLINYHSKRVDWNPDLRPEVNARVAQIVILMSSVAPLAPATARAQLVLAEILFSTDQAEAWRLVNAAIAAGLAGTDRHLLDNAQFAAAQYYDRLGQPAEARNAWRLLLEREQTPEFAGEVKLLIGYTYAHEGQDAKASGAFAEVANTEDCPSDVHACALFAQAMAARRLGRPEEALALLDAAIALDPENETAAAAGNVRYLLQKGR
jgi:tetratricopeptide (TPR) repeat protein